ncbi:hydroxyglutarate oxidase [Enemella dayhoffiae]|uniref:Hydroxyglutarate oxidase n=1 Tax=Enemella dayhoffiae TaxID=2016507 RepID=A0A255GSQ6_9ACTN|nr:L-2-hydroxyglutarate oxidase [Enemella dayhoffiae]OYO18631.1 hydroxyglutarate oxidase [Enemella dayhoffiae]
MSHVIIVGAGIVGLATARELVRRGHRVTVLEKEPSLAAHQTGRNSGVVHSGLYYRPGSLKAQLCTAGAESMVRFAREHGVAVEVCGKLVVATERSQLPALEELHRRGHANGVPCTLLDATGALAHEPHVRAVAALHVASTGIIDYRGVCTALADEVVAAGGEIWLHAPVTEIHHEPREVRVRAADREVRGELLVNCAGLYADRLARLGGVDPGLRIIPFRGEYFELAADQTHLVRGLIYPVPDPTLPFLGVHLTRMIGGGVHAGPNAVLGLAREGYRWRDLVPADLAETLAWPGLWRLGRRFWRTGADEVARSLFRRRFLGSLRELVPELGDDALRPAPSGVRAQALRPDGQLVDDFALVTGPRQLHVLNAPSPAATAALEIARLIADRVLGR